MMAEQFVTTEDIRAAVKRRDSLRSRGSLEPGVATKMLAAIAARTVSISRRLNAA